MLELKRPIFTISAIFIAALLAVGLGLFDNSFSLIHPVGSSQQQDDFEVRVAHAGGAAANRQSGYEFDLDPDGTPNGGTCRNGVNAPVTGAPKLEPFAIRVGVGRGGSGGGRLKLNAQIEYDTATAFSSPTQVTTLLGGNHFQIVINPNYSVQPPTGLQLEPGKAGPTFVLGVAVDGTVANDGSNKPSEGKEITIRAGQNTEVQFNIQATDNSIEGQQYFFRITDRGAPLGGYDNHPDLTVLAAQGIIVSLCTDHGAYPVGTDIPAVVTAVVTDENGNAISGLSADDFATTVTAASASIIFTETATVGTYFGNLDISELPPSGSPSIQVTVADADGVIGSGSVGFNVLDPPFEIVLITDKAQYSPDTDTTAVLTAQIGNTDYDYSLKSLTTFVTTLDGAPVNVTFQGSSNRSTARYSGDLDISGLATGTHTATVSISDALGATESGTGSFSIGEGAAAPTVTGCNPDLGSPGSQLTVTVSGSGFQGGASADFGEKIVVRDGTQFVSGNELLVSIKVHPKAAPGPRDVTITNPDGQSATGKACFKVQ